MWKYVKTLEYPVNIKKKDLRMAKYLVTQYGGANGELAAAWRYLNQRYTMPDDKGKSLLTDIGTEELAHVEIISTMIYQLMKDVYTVDPNFDFDTDDLDFDDEDAMSDYVKLCEKYNKVYAAVENSDIEYAMAMAWRWLRWNSETYLTYMTQNDDRVRPWHYALQGFTAKRDDFPAWMIPPIEWGCRCFLVNDSNYYSKLDIRNVQAKAPEKPKELDGVFAESVCKCGRIFSKSHHYFNIDKKDTRMLKGIVKNIRKVYYGKKD